MIGVTIITTAQEGKGEELAAAWLNAAKLVLQQDPDCKGFTVSRNKENPDELLCFEIYTSQEALDAHNASELSKELLPTIIPLVAGPPTMYISEILS